MSSRIGLDTIRWAMHIGDDVGRGLSLVSINLGSQRIRSDQDGRNSGRLAPPGHPSV